MFFIFMLLLYYLLPTQGVYCYLFNVVVVKDNKYRMASVFALNVSANGILHRVSDQ